MAAPVDVRSLFGGFHLEPGRAFGRRLVLPGGEVRTVTAGEHLAHIVRCAHGNGTFAYGGVVGWCVDCGTVAVWERGA